MASQPCGDPLNRTADRMAAYRAAQVGLGKTAMEAGNSESEAKRSYNDAMSEADAAQYFSICRPVLENP
jgi:hypothetical protein